MSDEPAERCALDSALLRRVAARMGFALTADEVEQFERYAAELVTWNDRMNLTGITQPDEIALRHVIDSLVCLRGIDAAPNGPLDVIDVGTGAGLPGLALKVVRPVWSLTLVESVGKKARFLRHVVEELGLEGVTVLRARAEDVGRQPAHRGRYDVATARAVAALPTLAEYLLPLLTLGGRMLAPKGTDIADELAALEGALATLGGRLVSAEEYVIPGVDGRRQLVVVEKTRETAADYPRRVGVPAKRPLG